MKKTFFLMLFISFSLLILNNCANYNSPTLPDSIKNTVTVTTNASGGVVVGLKANWSIATNKGAEYDGESIDIQVKKGNNTIDYIQVGTYDNTSGSSGSYTFKGDNYKFGDEVTAYLWLWGPRTNASCIIPSTVTLSW